MSFSKNSKRDSEHSKLGTIRATRELQKCKRQTSVGTYCIGVYLDIQTIVVSQSWYNHDATTHHQNNINNKQQQRQLNNDFRCRRQTKRPCMTDVKNRIHLIFHCPTKVQIINFELTILFFGAKDIFFRIDWVRLSKTFQNLER